MFYWCIMTEPNSKQDIKQTFMQVIINQILIKGLAVGLLQSEI